MASFDATWQTGCFEQTGIELVKKNRWHPIDKVYHRYLLALRSELILSGQRNGQGIKADDVKFAADAFFCLLDLSHHAIKIGFPMALHAIDVGAVNAKLLWQPYCCVRQRAVASKVRTSI